MSAAACTCEKTEIVRACRSDGDEAGLEEAGQPAATLIWTAEGLASACERTTRASIHGHGALALNQSKLREQQASRCSYCAGHHDVWCFESE
jgi:hypothetical protein